MQKINSDPQFLVSEIEVRYVPSVKPSKLPKISDYNDAHFYFRETWDMEKIHLVEQFKVMLLNTANKILGICTLSTGSISYTIADPKQVFGIALVANATGIIIAHNHPSGNLQASQTDIELTEKFKQAAAILDIRLLDHIILTSEGYYSFASDGVL